MKVSNFKLQVTGYKLRVTHLLPRTSYLIPLFAFCFFSVFSSYGQLSTGEIPYSWDKGRGEITIESIPMVTMPYLDLETLHREDLLSNGNGGPFRFGYSEKVNLTMSNSGSWTTTTDGGQLWTLRIYSPDALSLNLLYDSFWLPDGAKFYIYSEDKKQHIGAFTSKNNNGNKEDNTGFATAFLFTKNIVLEYYEPADTYNTGIISICNVISGYRYADEMHRDFDPTPGCFGSVLSDPNLSVVKNAVALVVMGDVYCSGALLNTTANDNRPTFLSAEHCFSFVVGTPPPSSWIFYWNYDWEKLTSTDSIPVDPKKTTTGANMLASNQNTDFMLLHLTEDPIENNNVNLYYLGWDKTGNTNVPSTYCIHHPGGQKKMYARSDFNIYNYPYQIFWEYNYQIYNISPPNSHWLVKFTEYSISGGSSGSPLLTADNKRVIGQLHGHRSNGCPPDIIPITYFGRFDVSWDGNSSSERLKDWLDPINSGLSVIDGMEPIPYQCEYILSLSDSVTGTNDYHAVRRITSTQEIESGSTTYKAGELITLLPGFHAKLRSNFTAQIEECEIIQRTILSVPEMEDWDVPENSTSQTLTQSLSQPQVNLHPNPNSGTFQLETNFSLSDIFTLKVMDMLGVTVYETKNITSNTISLENSAAGFYCVVIILKDGTVLTQKMMIQR